MHNIYGTFAQSCRLQSLQPLKSLLDVTSKNKILHKFSHFIVAEKEEYAFRSFAC